MINGLIIELVRAITCTFRHGFHNNLAQLLSLRSKSVILNNCSSRLKVKLTPEGQVIKWSQTAFVRAIACTFMHGFKVSWHSY